MKSVAVHEFSPGAFIFREGFPGDEAFILTEGTIEISVRLEDAKRVLDVLYPVSVFGEMALLLDDQNRTASAQALVKSKVAVIKREDFERFFQDSPVLIGSVLQALVRRLRKTTQESLATPNLFLAVAEVLSMLKEHHPRRLDPDFVAQRLSRTFRVPVAQINETLIALESHGLIETQTVGNTSYLDVVQPDTFLDRVRLIHRAING